MSRNWYDAEHLCPEAGGEQVDFRVLIGNPPVCPVCERVVSLRLEKESTLDKEGPGSIMVGKGPEREL